MRSMRFLPLWMCFMVAAAVSVSPAADTDTYWPAWRGPAATGVAPAGEPPVTWSENENVLWKVPIPGRGLSTPIIWGDRLYLTTAVAAGQRPDPETATAAEAALPEWRQERGVAPLDMLQFTVMALDRNSGETVWEKVVRRQAPHEGTHEDASWASASAVTDGEMLIVSFGSYGTYGLDLDGKVLWERDLGDMRTRRGFGEGSTPALHGDVVVVNWDHEGPSFIEALDRRTGDTLWKKDRDEVTSWSTPLILHAGGRDQVVINATGRSRGYDLKTGEVIWELGGMTVNTIPSPVAQDELVLLASGYRGAALQAVDLSAARGDLTDSKSVKWMVEQDTPYVPSLLLADGRVYYLKGNTGILSCLSAADGKELYTRQRIDGISNVYAAPVAGGGRIYITGRQGATAVLAGGDAYKVLAVNELDDRFDASAAIAGDTLYLRGHAFLYALQADEPSHR